jgi:dihydroxyacetone kinase-like predicted kinase
MLEQNRELRASRNIEDKEQGIVVVSNGEGINSLFKELGVDFIIKGGQTMNPSAQEIATAVDRVHAKTVFVFPNNKNIILSAMNAQSLTNKTIVVIPTKSINEGISAVITFSADTSVEENTQNFITATNSVVSASVTYAVRNTKMDNLDIKEGDIIGLDEKTIIAKGKSPNEVANEVVTKLMRDRFASVTLFYGEGVKETQANALVSKLQSKNPNCEITAIDGGQSVYYYLISLE